MLKYYFMKPRSKIFAILTSLFIILSVAGLGYGGYRFYLTNFDLQQIKNQLSAKVAELQEAQTSRQNLETELFQAQTDNAELARRLNTEQEKNSFFAKQIGEIQGTVNTLEKLSQTDEELLQKYSKVFFLNEHYIPDSLTLISDNYIYEQNEIYQIHTKVQPFLNRLMEAAITDNVPMQIISAYRSFGTQASLKSGYSITYGSGANKFSADQGYSEHQLGTTIDLTTPETGASFSKFKTTPAYQWLLNNAQQYGFILSYPEANKYFQFEPWHWRFVGVTLAAKLHDTDQYFYGLDQREIDTYLVSIFDWDCAENWILTKQLLYFII